MAPLLLRLLLLRLLLRIVLPPPSALLWRGLLLYACMDGPRRLQRSAASAQPLPRSLRRGTCPLPAWPPPPSPVCLTQPSAMRNVSAPRFYLGTWNMEGFMAEGRQVRTLREILARLRETYCGAIGYEVRALRGRGGGGGGGGGGTCTCAEARTPRAVAEQCKQELDCVWWCW